MSRAGERLAVLTALFAPGRAAGLIALLDDPEAAAIADRAALLGRAPREGRLSALRASLDAPGRLARAALAASRERGPVAAAMRGDGRGLPPRSRLLGRLLAEALSR